MNAPTNLAQLKITPQHLQRKAVVYSRQSSPKQVREHLDSQLNQRALVERAEALGWHRERIEVLDGDLGQSAAHAQGRDDFKALAAEVALGHVGIAFGWDVSRLARNNADWYQLLDLAALFGTLIGDSDGVYDPRVYNDRLLLGLKGTLSEAELYMLRQRLNAGRLSKVQRGEYVQRLPTGRVRLSDGRVVKDPDVQVRHLIDWVLAKFEELGSCRKVLRYCKAHQILPCPDGKPAVSKKGRCYGKSPPSQPCARASLIPPTPAPLSTLAGRPIPPASSPHAPPPGRCVNRWPSGSASATTRIRPTSAGTSSWPTRHNCAITLAATPNKPASAAAPPGKGPPCYRAWPPADSVVT